MHRSKSLVQEADVQYLYDGSMPGFYCCAFESVYAHELPAAIDTAQNAQPSLFEKKWIETDMEKARRVRSAFFQKGGPRAQELLETVLYSCLLQKERKLLQFLLLAFEEGFQTSEMAGHPLVAQILKAERHLLGERHLLVGFIRFETHNGALVANITPKNFVLPFLAEHFTDRYKNEDFLIYDKTHQVALTYIDGRTDLIQMQELSLVAPDSEETQYQALWKRFYDTIAIEARINPKLRMNHMPKRYWENMTEMKERI